MAMVGAMDVVGVMAKGLVMEAVMAMVGAMDVGKIK
jgi:hypothetical protein